jgi:hypothetical protein
MKKIKIFYLIIFSIFFYQCKFRKIELNTFDYLKENVFKEENYKIIFTYKENDWDFYTNIGLVEFDGSKAMFPCDLKKKIKVHLLLDQIFHDFAKKENRIKIPIKSSISYHVCKSTLLNSKKNSEWLIVVIINNKWLYFEHQYLPHDPVVSLRYLQLE